MKPFKVALWIAKFVAALTLLLVVIPAGIFYGGNFLWCKYEDHRDAKEYEIKQAKEDAEQARLCRAWEAEHPLGSPLDKSENGVVWDSLHGCYGPLEDAYTQKLDEYVKAHKKAASNDPWEEAAKTYKAEHEAEATK